MTVIYCLGPKVEVSGEKVGDITELSKMYYSLRTLSKNQGHKVSFITLKTPFFARFCISYTIWNRWTLIEVQCQSEKLRNNVGSFWRRGVYDLRIWLLRV